MTVVFRPAAIDDLSAIWDYSTKTWSIDQAQRYVRMIYARCHELLVRPGLGRPCPEIRIGYFRSRIGRHVIFYRTSDGGIEVVRILHERMDVSQHMDGALPAPDTNEQEAPDG